MTTASQEQGDLLYIPPGTIYGPVEIFSTDWSPDSYGIPCLYNKQENTRMSKILREKCGLPIEMVHGWKRTYLDYNRNLWKYSVTFYHPDPNRKGKGYHTIHKRPIGQVDEKTVKEFLQANGKDKEQQQQQQRPLPGQSVELDGYITQAEFLRDHIEMIEKDNANLKTMLIDLHIAIKGLYDRATQCMEKLRLNAGGGFPE